MPFHLMQIFPWYVNFAFDILIDCGFIIKSISWSKSDLRLAKRVRYYLLKINTNVGLVR